jgi:hypothetical protein
LSRSSETGVLHFSDAGQSKTLYFREGKIAYATSSVADDRLGEFLLKRGQITVRQFLDASKLVSASKRLGAALVDLQILSPDELIVSVQKHVEEIVMSLFDWTKGEYEFVIRDISADAPVILDLGTESVIVEGIRRIRDFTRVFAGVGSLDIVLRASDQADHLVYKLDLDGDESQVISLVNGRLTVEQILSLSYLSNFETLRILFALLSVGVLERGAAPGGVDRRREVEEQYELEEIVDQYNRGFGNVYAFVEGRLGERAHDFADAAVSVAAQSFPRLFEGIDLRGGGRVDFDQILANLSPEPSSARRPLLIDGLNELAYALLLKVGETFGREAQDRMASRIRSGFSQQQVSDG